MNAYSKISTASTHKSRSIDFSDFFSFSPQTSKPQQQEQQEPDDKQVKKSKIQHPVPEAEREKEDEGRNGERFGVIFGRSGSVSSASGGFQATVKRAFSMRRSSSVSERYCRIHDQYMAIASPIAIAEEIDDDDDDDDGTRRSMKKKLRGGSKIFKACKRLLRL